MLANSTIADAIRQRALELGFDACGFAGVEPLNDDGIRLSEWLRQGYQADMGYMANHFEKRIDPTLLVDGAKTVISLIHNYYPSKKPINNDGPVIARYAYGLDYHDVLKDKLHQLYHYIKDELFLDLEGRVFTDSAPVLERAWAQRAGLGWIGKNSNLINPKIGSYFFIAELIVNLPLPETSSTIKDYCGGCTKCIDACPTQAIIAPHVVDASKCISYWTIENKTDIPVSFDGLFGNRIFGCDICQEVCPWNRKAQPHNEPLFEPKEALMAMQSMDWEGLTSERFSLLFKGSAVKRAKYSGLVRNIRFVTKN